MDEELIRRTEELYEQAREVYRLVTGGPEPKPAKSGRGRVSRRRGPVGRKNRSRSVRDSQDGDS